MAKAKENFLQDDDTNITPAVLMRRITGQEELPEVHNITSVQESVQVHNKPDNITNNLTHLPEDNEVSIKEDKSISVAEDNERTKRIKRAEAWVAEAEENGETPTLVTMRVPAKLHDYLERYVRRINDNSANKRKRFLKQDAIAAAFISFYADHPMPEKMTENEDDL